MNAKVAETSEKWKYVCVCRLYFPLNVIPLLSNQLWRIKMLISQRSLLISTKFSQFVFWYWQLRRITLLSLSEESLLIKCVWLDDSVSESKAEVHAALWRIPPVDDNEPPPDSPGISPGSGHSRSLQLICHLDNKHENIRRLVNLCVNCVTGTLSALQYFTDTIFYFKKSY